MTMERIPVSEHLWQYHFPIPERRDYLDPHITVFRDGDGVLVLDTGFPNQAEQVKTDLAQAGLSVEKVVLSHYHPDHFSGYEHFEGVPLYVSRHYRAFYDYYRREKAEAYLPLPTVELADQDELDFGAWHFRFHRKPGHSPCTLVSQVNEGIYHVGDLVFANDQGLLSLPYVGEGGDVDAFLESLAWLEGLDFETILLAHGCPLQDKALFRSYVERTAAYLEAIRRTRGTAALEDCLPGDAQDYIYQRFHEMNCANVKAD